MTLVDAAYLLGLAGTVGYVLVGRVPSVLHVPLLSGANFVHAVVLVGAIVVFAATEGAVARAAGFVAIALASANAVGGLLLTERLFTLFERVRTGRGPSGEGPEIDADGEPRR